MAGLHTGGSVLTPRHCPFPLSQPDTGILCPSPAVPGPFPALLSPTSYPLPKLWPALGPGNLGTSIPLHTSSPKCLLCLKPDAAPDIPTNFCAALALAPLSSHPALSSSHQHPPTCQPLPLHPGLPFPPAHSVTSRDRMPWVPGPHQQTTFQHSLFLWETLLDPLPPLLLGPAETLIRLLFLLRNMIDSMWSRQRLLRGWLTGVTPLRHSRALIYAQAVSGT